MVYSTLLGKTLTPSGITPCMLLIASQAKKSGVSTTKTPLCTRRLFLMVLYTSQAVKYVRTAYPNCNAHLLDSLQATSLCLTNKQVSKNGKQHSRAKVVPK